MESSSSMEAKSEGTKLSMQEYVKESHQPFILVALLNVQLLSDRIMVRVGGGWDTLEHFLLEHDPCRIKKFVSGIIWIQSTIQVVSHGSKGVYQGVCIYKGVWLDSYVKALNIYTNVIITDGEFHAKVIVGTGIKSQPVPHHTIHH